MPKLAILDNQNLFTSLQKLHAIDMPMKASYGIAKIGKILEKEFEVFESLRLSALKDCCLKDDDGKVIEDENKRAKFKDDAARDLFSSKFKEICDIDFEGYKIKISYFGDCKVSPDLLNGIIDFLEE